QKLDSESAKILDKRWMAGSKDCSKPESLLPPYDVLEVNSEYFILRQNKCVNFEAPFIYLFLGEHTAFLFDTGATSDEKVFPIRAWVDEKIKKSGKDLRLIVAHSHAHGDHTAGDYQFLNRP